MTARNISAPKNEPPGFPRAALDALRYTQKARVERDRTLCPLRRSRPIPAATGRLPDQRPPLVGLASLSEVVPAGRSAAIGSALPLRRCQRPGLGVFLTRRCRAESFDVRTAPLLGLASPSEYDRGRPAEALSGDSAFPGVSAPTALAVAGTHFSGICLVPVPVRLQGFSPSCRVTSPASFRPFKAGDAHGVLPFEASPSGRSRGASRRPLPSCRCRHSAYATEATYHRWQTRLQGLAPRRSPSRSHGD